MKTEMQIERIARCEGQATTAQDARRVDGDGDSPTWWAAAAAGDADPLDGVGAHPARGGSGTKSVPTS